MLEVPTIMFYVGTIAMVIVSGLLIIFLFYLIKAARIVLRFAAFLEEEGGKMRGKIEDMRRMVRLVASFFHK